MTPHVIAVTGPTGAVGSRVATRLAIRFEDETDEAAVASRQGFGAPDWEVRGGSAPTRRSAMGAWRPSVAPCTSSRATTPSRWTSTCAPRDRPDSVGHMNSFNKPSIRELLDLGGKTAVVTGGAMGIGRGIVERLHEAGAAIVVADLADEESAELVAHLESLRPDSALAVHTDVCDEAAVDATVAAAAERFGSVDILVNAAGIYPSNKFVELEAEVFDRVLRTNLHAVFLTMRAAARQMIAQGGGGTIINVTSVDALRPTQPQFAHYDASKHGAWGMTKNVALELAEHGITVNALAPGAVMTPGAMKTGGKDSPHPSGPSPMEVMKQRIPLGRPGEPDEMGASRSSSPPAWPAT